MSHLDKSNTDALYKYAREGGLVFFKKGERVSSGLSCFEESPRPFVYEVHKVTRPVHFVLPKEIILNEM